MAEVWAVRHRLLGTRYALKLLTRGTAGQTERLLAEGRAQARLRHPNIVPVQDVLPVGDALGLVMPLIQGPPLDQLLRRYRPTHAEAVALIRAITRGLAHAHSHGLIHRDLKPANVLLEAQDGRWVPRIADFGLVKDTDDAPGLTRIGTMMGTLNYAAPEQLLDAASVDHRADLFSLGVILVELLAGTRPFQGATVGEVLDAYAAGPDLSGVAVGWRPLCAALMAFSVSDRLPSCAALVAQLDALYPDDAQTPAASVFDVAVTLQRDATATAPVAETDTAGAGVSHNLPSEQDTFVGRFQAKEQLSAALGQEQLVAVLGAGGTGKTRLAVNYAHLNLAAYPGGVWFCDLSEAHSHEAMRLVVARELGVALGKADPDETLGYAIAGRGRCLIVLDNFEQLVSSSAAVVAQWAEQAPQARFLVTSRIRLGVAGELPFALSTLNDADAIELFVRRARARSPAFDPVEHPTLPALIRQLDNLPLAIELAAARVQLLRPAQMLRRMDQRFQLLARAGASPGRADTLRATIDWSWELLTDWEQATFAQCSVFEGGFTLEAAEAVVDLSAHPGAPWLPDVVQSLIDKSLLRSVAGSRAQHARFGMLVSLQEYAKARLKERGDGAACSRRHAAHYDPGDTSAWVQHAGLRGDVVRRREATAEIDNLYAAAARTADRAPLRSARLTLAASLLAQDFRPLKSSVADVERALARLEGLDEAETALVRAELWTRLGQLRWALGQAKRALNCYDGAEQLARGADAERLRGHIQQLIGLVKVGQGHLRESEGYFRESAAIAQRVRDDQTELCSRAHMSFIQCHLGRREQGRAGLEDALVAAREVGSLTCVFLARGYLGTVLWELGQPLQAEPHLVACLTYFRELNDKSNMAVMMRNLARLQYIEKGEAEEASRNLEQARLLSRRAGNRYREVRILQTLAFVEADAGMLEEARGHYEEALRLYEGMGTFQEKGNVIERLGELHALKGEFAAARGCWVRALEVFRASKSGAWALRLRIKLADLEDREGDREAAAASLREGLESARADGLPREESLFLVCTGLIAARRGDLDAARAHAREAMALHRAHTPSPLIQSLFLLMHCEIALRAGDLATARADADEILQHGVIKKTSLIWRKRSFEALLQQLEAAEA